MPKKVRLRIAALALLTALAPGTFAQAPTDQRAAITLLPAERDMILVEMRAFLSGTQAIVDGLARSDMKAVASAARGLGRASVQGVPPALRMKLPKEFRELGMSVHMEFDQIALDAEALGERDHVLTLLGATLQKCVGCHAGWRLEAAAPAQK